MKIGWNKTALVDLQPRGFKIESVGDRPAADGHERHIELANFVLAARSLAVERCPHGRALLLERLDLCAEHKFDALLFENPPERLADLEIRTGENLRHHLDDQDLRAEPPVDGREL